MSETQKNGSANGFNAQLQAEDGSLWPLSGEMRVGRSADCEITIDDPRVSRGHAKITLLGEHLTVEDLGSANGTRVNDGRTEGVVELADGDSVMFDKHRFKVIIESASVDMDATLIDPDATIIGGFDTVVSEPEPKSEPKPVAEIKPESKPEAEPAPAPAPGPAPDLPGSWVESDNSEYTQILMPGDNLKTDDSPQGLERESDLPHFLVGIGNGEYELLELELSTGSDPDVWEIGRGDSCEITLTDPSVSTRHAQLIHQDGRWSLVNLLASNGTYVNDEKRLKTYLSDGDQIRLGLVNVIFRAAAGEPARAKVAGPSSTSAEPRRAMPIVAPILIVIGVALLLWLIF